MVEAYPHPYVFRLHVSSGKKDCGNCKHYYYRPGHLF